MQQSDTSSRDLETEAAVRRELEEYYRSGPPPWDTRVTPPELEELTGPKGLPPGRALELGCGTGTNSIFLSQRGWDVVGVDLVDRAVEIARERAIAADAHPRLLVGDATRLEELDVTGTFDLFFDLSCFCGVPQHRLAAYADGVTARAEPGATLLMFAYGPGAFGEDYPGVTADGLQRQFAGWTLLDITQGTNEQPTAWYTLRRSA